MCRLHVKKFRVSSNASVKMWTEFHLLYSMLHFIADTLLQQSVFPMCITNSQLNSRCMNNSHTYLIAVCCSSHRSLSIWRSGLVRWCSDQGSTGSNPTAVSMSLFPWARHFTPNCSCGDCPQYWVCKQVEGWWIQSNTNEMQMEE